MSRLSRMRSLERPVDLEAEDFEIVPQRTAAQTDSDAR